MAINPKTLGYFREKKGLTQGEFGKLVGLTKGMVSAWEKETRAIKPKYHEKIAVALGATMEELQKAPPADREKAMANEQTLHEKIKRLEAEKRVLELEKELAEMKSKLVEKTLGEAGGGYEYPLSPRGKQAKTA